MSTRQTHLRNRALGSLAVIAAGLGLIAAPPAAAAQGDCASGYTFPWEDAGYQGGAVSFARYIPDLSQWKTTNGHKANDTLSSAKNRGQSEGTCLFQNAYGGGASRHMSRGASWYSLADHQFNDTISSAYFDGFVSC